MEKNQIGAGDAFDIMDKLVEEHTNRIYDSAWNIIKNLIFEKIKEEEKKEDKIYIVEQPNNRPKEMSDQYSCVGCKHFSIMQCETCWECSNNYINRSNRGADCWDCDYHIDYHEHGDDSVCRRCHNYYSSKKDISI